MYAHMFIVFKIRIIFSASANVQIFGAKINKIPARVTNCIRDKENNKNAFSNNLRKKIHFSTCTSTQKDKKIEYSNYHKLMNRIIRIQILTL